MWGLGFGVWGLGFGVRGSGFGVWGLGFGFGVWGLLEGSWVVEGVVLEMRGHSSALSRTRHPYNEDLEKDPGTSARASGARQWS